MYIMNCVWVLPTGITIQALVDCLSVLVAALCLPCLSVCPVTCICHFVSLVQILSIAVVLSVNQSQSHALSLSLHYLLGKIFYFV